MPKRLRVINPMRCIGCNSCTLACARKWWGVVSLRRSALHVRTSGGIESSFVVVVCRACKDPPCARVCRTGALKPRKGGGVKIDPSLCNACGDCAEACIIGAITPSPDDEKPIVCHSCGYCAQYCPHEVLALVEVEELL